MDKKSWQEFRETGLFWWINQLLHTFGWVLVADVDKDRTVKNVYPARTKFRGFSEEDNAEGYTKVSKYMKDNAEQLYKESKE